MTEQTDCPICDKERVRLQGEYARNLIDLREELYESLATLIGAHARGEHSAEDE